MLEVLEAGLLDTIQDRGRPHHRHLGVPEGGAADSWSHAVANLLAGNDPAAAALEMTIVGPRMRALADITVALAGADLGARVEPGNRPLAPGRSVRLRAGDELVAAGRAAGGRGARAYLAVAGGIDVPVVLGSRSTCRAGSFGGVDGRPLRPGDVIHGGEPGGEPVDAWPAEPIAPHIADRDGTVVLRLIAHAGAGAARRVVGRRWTVTPASDRMGLRLDGDATPSEQPEVTSHGVVRGTVQVPPDGRPIVLLADHQPTGGYPVAGVVIAADLPALGQLAPGDGVRFVLVDLVEARAALEAQRAAWAATLDLLRADAAWHDLWRSAGA